jgi:hypothetical protein
MPWRKVSIMESREEFCELELKEGASIRALRRRLRITLGYSCYRRRTRLLRLEEDPADERAPDIFGGVLLRLSPHGHAFGQLELGGFS